MKKLGWVILILAMGVWGCVSVDHTTVVDTDHSGYANGQYRDVRHGKVCDFGIFGTGAGAAAASSSALAAFSNLTAAANNTGNALTSGASSSGGGGMLGLRVYPAPTQGDPVPFARSIAMINYSKRLTKVSYDDSGLVNYEFGEAGPKRISSFGYQPIH